MEDRKDECKELLRVIYKQKYVQDIYQQKAEDLRAEADNGDQIGNNGYQIGNNGYKTIPLALAISIILQVFQQFSGVNAIVLYAQQIFSKSFNNELALLAPMLINFTVFLSGFLSFVILSHFGRKSILIIGFLIGCITNCFIGVGLGGDPIWALIGALAFMINYGCSLGPVVWLYIPEVVPPSMISLTTAFNWVSYAFVVTLFPITTERLFGGNPSK